MIRMFTVAALALALFAPPAVAGPGGGPPGLERRGFEDGPPPHVIDEVRGRETQILAWLAENDPESHARLSRLKQRDPRHYIGQLVRVDRLMSRADHDPSVIARHRAMQELERTIRGVAADWSSLDAKEQKAQRAELVSLAEELLELKQEERRARLEEIRAKAAELEADIEARDRDRKAVIEGYLDDLLGEAPPGL